MTRERTFETGGEVLRIGSIVVVFDGNSQKELSVTEIGTKRIFIESPYGKPIPYSQEDRKSQQGAYGSYFRTRTEVSQEQERILAKSRLRDLGVEARVAGYGEDGLAPYSTETLNRVADLLEAEIVKSGECQQG